MALAGLNLASAFEHSEEVLDYSDAANSDLVWDIANFDQGGLAQQLMLQFERSICIYSPCVRQIYTNFNVFFPREEPRKLIILPNPFAHFDVFHDVPPEAIRPTGLRVMPNYYSQKPELLLRIPLKNQPNPFRTMPFLAGIKLLNSRRPVDQPLLPILAKGDLQELDDGVPSLHLHSINLNKLGGMSPMEVAGIRAAITEKLQSLAK